MPKPTPNNFRWFLACVIASFRVCLRFLSHRYPSWYFKQFYKWMQIELWSICEILIDSIVIWVNMDPSLVIKGVDENIKIFCSLVVLFFSLSLSLSKMVGRKNLQILRAAANCRMKAKPDLQTPWKNTSHGLRIPPDHFDIWISGSTCHTMTFHDIPMDNLGCQWLGTPGNDYTTIETIPYLLGV